MRVDSKPSLTLTSSNQKRLIGWRVAAGEICRRPQPSVRIRLTASLFIIPLTRSPPQLCSELPSMLAASQFDSLRRAGQGRLVPQGRLNRKVRLLQMTKVGRVVDQRE